MRKELDLQYCNNLSMFLPNYTTSMNLSRTVPAKSLDSYEEICFVGINTVL